MALMLKVVDSS